jgi:hypothetical protein
MFASVVWFGRSVAQNERDKERDEETERSAV